MNNICVITSAHPRFDIRIFHKQCKTLVREGYKVSLFVCDGLGDDIVDGVQIHDIGAASSRLHRIFFKTAELYKAVSKKNFDVYHFHDPEFTPFAWLLSFQKCKIIFDAHEDYFVQIKHKSTCRLFLGL